MKSLVVNICRVLVSLTFLFSGFVKAVDPVGTQYKLQDYSEAVGLPGVFPDWVTLSASVALAMVEFYIGMALLFAISRRFVSKVALAFMGVMTCITVWIYIADPVSDCGCFGDAVKLTNGETLAKNVVLLLMTAVIAWRPLRMPRMVSLTNQWIVSHYVMLFIMAVSIYSVYLLPLFDFRPYHIGANIPQGMEMPEGAEEPEFETTFIMEKDGVRKEFALEEYPDSTWTFIDSKTKIIKEGYVPPIHDFSIQTVEDGEDITEEVLADDRYTFLLIAPHLENADDSNFGTIDLLYEYAQDNGYGFYCLTASTEKGIAHWRDITGAEYPFCNTDETTLKTIIRSNPGLLLLKNGSVVGKWSHNDLPVSLLDNGGVKLDKKVEAAMVPAGPGTKIAYILLWFVMPMVLFVCVERMWIYFRIRKRRSKENKERKETSI